MRGWSKPLCSFLIPCIMKTNWYSSQLPINGINFGCSFFGVRFSVIWNECRIWSNRIFRIPFPKEFLLSYLDDCYKKCNFCSGSTSQNFEPSSGLTIYTLFKSDDYLNNFAKLFSASLGEASPRFTSPNHPWDWCIYLHEWLIFMVNVDKFVKIYIYHTWIVWV